MTYREAFERLWNEQSPEVITNARPDHAGDILAVFFDRADKRVCIFCKDLHADVYDQEPVIKAAEAAYGKGVKIEIVIQNGIPANNFATIFRKRKNRDGTPIFLNENKLSPPVYDLTKNFSFVDDRAYRFEPINTVMQATASTYSPDDVKYLDNVFGKIKALVSAESKK